MTEPDPLADLAAQLEQLRGDLARAQGEVGSLRRRYEDETGPAMLALSHVKQMREELADAIEKRRLKPPPAPWWRVDKEQGTEMLVDLREWVDGFLAPHYPGYAARLAGCYWRHMEAVWELSTLRAEWIRIYGDEENRDLAGALAWHDRYLPGVISRLAEAIKCAPGSCQRAPRR